jgi:hypothetical protein
MPGQNFWNIYRVRKKFNHSSNPFHHPNNLTLFYPNYHTSVQTSHYPNKLTHYFSINRSHAPCSDPPPPVSIIFVCNTHEFREQKCIIILNTVERNAKNKNTKDLVNNAFQELVDNGYAEKVLEKERLIGNISLKKEFKIHYIPCQATLNKNTTNVRIVMNCSSKTSTGYSLNDLLYTGPVKLPDFVKVLIKFRTQKYAFSLDISKMFLQIKLSHDGDNNLLRFLWKDKSASKHPTE